MIIGICSVDKSLFCQQLVVEWQLKARDLVIIIFFFNFIFLSSLKDCMNIMADIHMLNCCCLGGICRNAGK